MSLILLGAPLGNPGDASDRMRDVLSSADVIAAEDTRRLARLAGTLGVTVTGRVISYFEGNERRKTADLVEAMRNGATVALITDGGMPSVSDPGFRLVRATVDAGLPVTAAPGPSAVTTALALSGLPSDRFCFEGFPPRKRGERRALFASLTREPRTMIFFESPHRIVETLADLASEIGPERQAALCRELTKTYEEIRRASLAELAALAAADLFRGEITLVVQGADLTSQQSPTAQTLAEEVEDLISAADTSRKAAIAEVARRYDIPKRTVFDAVVCAKQDLPRHNDHSKQHHQRSDETGQGAEHP